MCSELTCLRRPRGDRRARVDVLIVRMRADCRLRCPARISVVVVVARVCTIVDCGAALPEDSSTCDCRSAGEVAVAVEATKALQDVHFICNFVWSRVSGVAGGRAPSCGPLFYLLRTYAIRSAPG